MRKYKEEQIQNAGIIPECNYIKSFLRYSLQALALAVLQLACIELWA